MKSRQKGHQCLEPRNPQPPKTLSKRGALDARLAPSNHPLIYKPCHHWLNTEPSWALGTSQDQPPLGYQVHRGTARNDQRQTGPGSDLLAELQIEVQALTSHLAQTPLVSSSKDSFTSSVTSFFSSSTAFKYLTRLVELRIISAS